MFHKIFQYAGLHKKNMYLATGILLAGVLMGVMPFIFAYQIIAPLVMKESIEVVKILLYVTGILLCLSLQAYFHSMGLSVSHKAAYNILQNLRISLKEKMQELPLGIVSEKGTGTIKKMFVDDVDSLELLLAHTLPEGIANLMVPIVIYMVMFVVDWKLALLSLASLPLGMIMMMIMFGVGMKKMDSYYKASAVMNNTIIEYINGMEVVKVFNRDSKSYEKLSGDVKNYRDFTLAWYKACWPFMAIYNSVISCTIILTLPVGAWFVLQGYSDLADLILVLCLSFGIGMPLIKALGFLPTMPQLNYKIEALEKILGAKPLNQKNQEFKGKDYTIEFENAVFGYEEKEVIKGISLTVKEGEVTALVGESGSGKSTLAKLLVHYYDLKEGSIKIGGQDITDMSLSSLNNIVSYVAQDQYLFNTSILENIRVGKLDATDEEVLEAARKAQCMEFIDKFPNKINMFAGDCGKALSGGQRQRISLARAILKNAPIVVLDEATAFADPENEEKMLTAIAELVQNKTLLVIAHRLQSTMEVDKIGVIHNGTLEGLGRHEELLKNCHIYKKLWYASQNSAGWKVNVKGGVLYAAENHI